MFFNKGIVLGHGLNVTGVNQIVNHDYMHMCMFSVYISYFIMEQTTE